MRSDSPQVDGFINLYKQTGPTSMDMVRQIKRLTGLRKRVGHGGTLDPLAEGVLPICFGQATRLMEHLLEGARHYRLKVHLGVTTTTYDGEGEVTRTQDPSGIDRETTEKALESFRGDSEQTPPMYSAIKVDGKRLYKLARSGIEVDRQPRKVRIPSIEIEEFAPPVVVMRVQSGRGAYMRSLAHDLGELLGCGGYLSGLVRLSSGPFLAEEAVSMDKLQEDVESWRDYLLPPDFALLHLKAVAVPKTAERYIVSGQPVRLPPQISVYAGYMEKYRAYVQDGRFLAVISFDKPNNQWRPYKVLNLRSASPYAPVTDE